MEVPATSAGSIADIRVPAGEVVPVGTVVAIILAEGEQADSVKPQKATDPVPAVAPMQASQPVMDAPAVATPVAVRRDLDPFNAVRTPERNFGPAALPGGVRVTPLARRLAAELGISLATLSGSGPHGRIVAQDVRNAELPSALPAAEAAPSATATPATSGASADQVKALYADVPFVEVDLTGMRRTIARRLVESKQTVPHFYLTADVRIDRMIELRRQINEGRSTRISVNDFVIKAYAAALRACPAANAVWAEDRILQFSRVDVGVAVSVDGGLFPPVLRGADAKSVSAIADEMGDLAARARAGKLDSWEYQGGAGSVSNLGMYGVRDFAAIINPPHATILAVGAGMRRPYESKDGGVAFGSEMTVTLSCDHRVVDGALGAELLHAFKSIIEEPLNALL
jgi:pyruvate dehydrogenase E2 component (dihydrolipoamide acetyltransferase)